MICFWHFLTLFFEKTLKKVFLIFHFFVIFLNASFLLKKKWFLPMILHVLHVCFNFYFHVFAILVCGSMSNADRTRTHAAVSAVAAAEQQPEGWFCLGKSGSRQGHPRYTGARSAGRPWVARTTVQHSSTETRQTILLVTSFIFSFTIPYFCSQFHFSHFFSKNLRFWQLSHFSMVDKVFVFSFVPSCFFHSSEKLF